MQLSRGLLTGLALLGYLTATLGVPLPQPAAATPEETAKPVLEVRPCGCAVEADAPCCCCGADPCCGATTPEPKPAVQTARGSDWLIGELVRQYRGLDRLWASGFLALPTPPPVDWVDDGPPVALMPLSPLAPLTPSFRPPAPPPRA